MILRTEIAQRVFGTPLLMHEGKAIAALSAIGGRVVSGGVVIEGDAEAVHHVAFENGRASMGRLGDRLGRVYDRERITPYDIVDGVAVIGIEGTLVHKGAYVGMLSGRTSYQGVQTQVARAMRDPAVRGVVFEVDSFGGEAAGVFETADMMAQLSARKPTIAILTDFALSGGYLLAAAARQIVMPPQGRAGSIGAVTLHAEFSKALADKGVKVTVIAAGKHKADGNEFEPLPKEVVERVRAGLEALRTQFAAYIGRFRGKRFTASAAMATEAADFRGADAVAMGMADAIGNPSAAFDAFIAEVNRAARPLS